MREDRVGHFAWHASGIPDDAQITTYHRYGGPRIQVTVPRYELAWPHRLLHPVLVPDADCNWHERYNSARDTTMHLAFKLEAD